MLNTKIKSVLLVRGAFGDMYEPTWKKALESFGVKVHLFDTHALTLPSVLGRLERRILTGPGILRIQKKLIQLVKQHKPDVTLIYQGQYFDRKTIEKLKPFTFVTGYHNDDPFGPATRSLRYRHLLKALPAYDGYHFYRQINVEESRKYGVRQAGLIMPHYAPWADFPCKLTPAEEEKYSAEVTFIGHHEPDFRMECLEKAVDRGIPIRIHGEKRFWGPALKKIGPLNNPELLPPVYGAEYRKALCGTKIALTFLSTKNRDSYTRRVFEIPVCGTFMLCQHTKKIEEILGDSCGYFRSAEEFCDMLEYFLSHQAEREDCAQRAMQVIQNSKMDIFSQIKIWLDDVSGWMDSV